ARLDSHAPSRSAEPLRSRTRRGFDDGFGTEGFRRQRSGGLPPDRRRRRLRRRRFHQHSFPQQRNPQGRLLQGSAFPAANSEEPRAPLSWRLSFWATTRGGKEGTQTSRGNRCQPTPRHPVEFQFELGVEVEAEGILVAVTHWVPRLFR